MDKEDVERIIQASNRSVHSQVALWTSPKSALGAKRVRRLWNLARASYGLSGLVDFSHLGQTDFSALGENGEHVEGLCSAMLARSLEVDGMSSSDGSLNAPCPEGTGKPGPGFVRQRNSQDKMELAVPSGDVRLAKPCSTQAWKLKEELRLI